MGYLKGEDINLGVGVETTRGTAVAPTRWVAGRTPAGVAVQVEKVQIKETKGSGMNSQGSEIIKSMASGDLEFNVRSNSIGYFLLPLLGKVTTAAEGSGYKHTFEVLTGNAQYPTLTLALSQLGQQDYQYKQSLVTALELKTPVNDLVNAKASFISVKETAVPDYTPTFSDDDKYFRHYDVTIKTASNVAGLATATPVKLKEFSLSIKNGGKVHQNISELYPGDVLASAIDISGAFKKDYDGEATHDAYTSNTAQALEINLQRQDIEISTGVYPTIKITLPKITYTKWTPERPLDNIVSESVNFIAHFSDDDAYGIKVEVTNTVSSYNS